MSAAAVNKHKLTAQHYGTLTNTYLPEVGRDAEFLRARVAALICIIGICGTRLIWVAFVFPSHHAFDWLMYCYPLSWIVTLIVMIPVAVRTLKRTLSRIEVND